MRVDKKVKSGRVRLIAARIGDAVMTARIIPTPHCKARWPRSSAARVPQSRWSSLSP